MANVLLLFIATCIVVMFVAHSYIALLLAVAAVVVGWIALICSHISPGRRS